MKRRAVLYWIIGILLVAIIVAGALYFDHTVRDFVSQHQNRALKNFMRNVSRIGDWPGHLALGLGLLGVAWWRGNKKWTRVFLCMLIALAVAGLVARVVKISTARARPSVKVEDVATRSHFSSKFHAFPSGHVAASMGFFGVLLLASRRIGIACLAVPILIGISRMYVGAHHFSDVICAMILGMLCAVLVNNSVQSKIENRKSKI